MSNIKTNKIICVNTKETFEHMKDACDKYGIDKGIMSKACHGTRNTAGKLRGESLKWMFLDKWNELSQEDKDTISKEIKTNLKGIVCLNTNEIFDDVYEASLAYNAKYGQIYRCCIKNMEISKDKVNFAGRINEDKIVWMLLNDYNKLSSCEIESFVDMGKKKRPKGTKVVCLNTLEIFDSIALASEAYKNFNLTAQDISNCCGKRTLFAGKKDEEPLKWIYFEEYESLSKEEIEFILKDTSSKRKTDVVCLNTREHFESIQKASNKYNVASSSISTCCRRLSNFAGTHNGDNLTWAYLEDYNKFSEENIEELLERARRRRLNNRPSPKVFCVTTGEIFETRKDILKKHPHIELANVSACCNKRTKTAGIIKGKRAVWMYYDEYVENNPKHEYSH